ncbi:MATE family efflux transporter [Paraliobacillus sediminis]|uniref:MATE family efflux transporter n=1 Tax=Paraliobacillus sediminis TaxID=1885916 RepID=UPI000E3C1E7C|nr:MATE family efflux transporter [Paraliobacillus sediminis]
MNHPSSVLPVVSHKNYMQLALPLVFATITTPLLGAVDTAVVGQLPDPVYIGGVAVGSLIFNTLYWSLGFLRVSTSGFTAQAHGANDPDRLALSFIRPAIIAAIIGCLFILFQIQIKDFALFIMQPTNELKEQILIYYNIRIWGAPFALMNYVILGWLMGSSKVRLTLFLQVGMNLTNIGLNILFVTVFSLGVTGVATATLLVEIVFMVIGLFFLVKLNMIKFSLHKYRAIFDKNSIVKLVRVNRDLMIRSICLLVVFTLFTSIGTQMGEAVLAANAILFQIHYLMSYCLDGFANASSILIGRSVGSDNKHMYKRTLNLSAIWGGAVAICLALILYLTSDIIFSLFTSIEEVKVLITNYQGWLLLFPLVSFWGLLLNGVFSGATEVVPIRNSLIIAMILFLIMIYFLIPLYANHGLWFAFILFSFARSIILNTYLPGLSKTLFKRGKV